MNEIVPFEFKECHYFEEWFKDMRNKKNLVQPCGSVSCSAQKVRVIEATHLFVCAFIVCRLHDEEVSPRVFSQLRKAISHYFSISSFMRDKYRDMTKDLPLDSVASGSQCDKSDSAWPDLFVISRKNKDDSPISQYESHISALWKLRDQVSLSTSLSLSFSHTPIGNTKRH